MRQLPANPPRYRYMVGPDGNVHGVGRESSMQQDCRCFVDENQISRTLNATLPPQLADLVDVAIAVYAVDRLSPRTPHRSDRYHFHWFRHLEVEIPLRNPELWSMAALDQALRDALAFLTGDDWRFRFVPLPKPLRRPSGQLSLFPYQPGSALTTALFSGGLDSLAGLCGDAGGADHGRVVLVSACTHSRLMALQRNLVRAIRTERRQEIIWVSVPIGLRRFGRPYDDDERTQRTRGFLFTALGAAIATVAGVSNLTMYENGVGAINLPYTAAQVGSESNRNTHPVALELVRHVIQLAIDNPFGIRNPSVFKTKGQLCSELRDLKLGRLAAKTISCDGFPRRVAGRPQCGLCTSCLLRRQSLGVAGLAMHDNPEDYGEDILHPRARLNVHSLHSAQAMLDQVAHLRSALQTGDAWNALVRAYPSLLETAAALTSSSVAPERALVALYQRYCDEWARFPLRLPGWSTAPAA